LIHSVLAHERRHTTHAYRPQLSTSLGHRFKGKKSGGVASIASMAAPIALSVLAPGLGTAIGTALGASGTGASILGSAILGGSLSGLGSSLTGGSIGKGVLGGALSGGLGAGIGAALPEMGINLGPIGNGALVGGLSSLGRTAVTGQDPLEAALSGAMTGSLSAGIKGAASEGPSPETVVNTGEASVSTPTGTLSSLAMAPSGSTTPMGNLTYGADPYDDAIFDASGYDAPDALVAGYQDQMYGPPASAAPPQFGGFDQPATGPMRFSVNSPGPTSNTAMQFPLGVGEDNRPFLERISDLGGLRESIGGTITRNPLQTVGALGLITALASRAGKKKPQSAVQPQADPLFRSPLPSYQYVNSSNPQARQRYDYSGDIYRYGQGPSFTFIDPRAPQAMKRGGLAQVAAPAGGQDDTVPARLSVGEYVIPADVVAHLGDGSSESGAKRLDEALNQIRQQKTGHGKYPPKARSPLAYLAGA